MAPEEFDKVWRLLEGLWPAYTKRVSRRIWEVGTAPFRMADVSDAIMEYARHNKFFPDLADITSALKPEEEKPVEDDQESFNFDEKFNRQIIARYGSAAAYRQKLERLIEELERK